MEYWSLLWLSSVLLGAASITLLSYWSCGSKRRQRSPDCKVRTLVVLGSGGHTTEMLHLLTRLPKQRYHPLFYVLADTDHTSKAKVEASPLAPQATEYIRIPRSREVGESWIRSLMKTAYACAWAVAIVIRKRPQLIICNGPGTCLPICLAAFGLRTFFLSDVRIVFCESFCRVKTLSLTGKIFYNFRVVDRFVVQWPALQKRFPRAEYIGTIC
uniref:UDP-N-acetylglucosamine transferase subunit ALG14 n=1 Tax=Octactis speculum TaxID=3111310 RepID=A0A7S2HDE1_9STRA|mmetsp:Transcript_63818/g.87712  ORF Transcript_63818/g.87712 Transcript_63818/m.87712 type:complete len:214 (+) Transcript_63818:73-714(+)